MAEFKVTITAPELAEAINNLASALTNATHTKCTCAKVEEATDEVRVAGVTSVDNVTALTPPYVATEPAPQVVPTAPASAPQTAPDVQSTQNVSSPTQYTLDEIATAGAGLIEAGKLNELMALLGKFGVESLVALSPDKYNEMAAELRSLGAKL